MQTVQEFCEDSDYVNFYRIPQLYRDIFYEESKRVLDKDYGNKTLAKTVISLYTNEVIFYMYFNSNDRMYIPYSNQVFFPGISSKMTEMFRLIFAEETENYLVCPLRLDNSQLQFQIGITGTVKEGETHKDALFREVGEEVGLVPQRFTDEAIVYEKLKRRYIYSVNICDCRNLTEEDNIHSNTPDIRVEKIACFIYGTLPELLDYISSNILHDKEDKIAGVGIVRIERIKEYLNSRN